MMIGIISNTHMGPFLPVEAAWNTVLATNQQTCLAAAFGGKALLYISPQEKSTHDGQNPVHQLACYWSTLKLVVAS